MSFKVNLICNISQKRIRYYLRTILKINNVFFKKKIILQISKYSSNNLTFNNLIVGSNYTSPLPRRINGYFHVCSIIQIIWLMELLVPVSLDNRRPTVVLSQPNFFKIFICKARFRENYFWIININNIFS